MNFTGFARILGQKAVKFDGDVSYRVTLELADTAHTVAYAKSAESVVGYAGAYVNGEIKEAGEKIVIGEGADAKEVTLKRRTITGDVTFTTTNTLANGKAFLAEATLV